MLATVEKIVAVKTHPNADALDIVQVLGYECIVKRGTQAVGDEVVFIQPDTILPVDRPWAAELLKYTRRRLCAVIPSVPLSDQLLAQKLLLETDEAAFLAKANVWEGLQPRGRRALWNENRPMQPPHHPMCRSGTRTVAVQVDHTPETRARRRAAAQAALADGRITLGQVQNFMDLPEWTVDRPGSRRERSSRLARAASPPAGGSPLEDPRAPGEGS